MGEASTARPFPPLLIAALGAPLVLFALGLLIGVLSKSALAMIFWILGVGLELVAIPIAIFMLLRGGYRRPLNIVITLLAAIPPAIVALAAFTFFFGHVHF